MPMKGWITWVGAAGSILTGLYLIIAQQDYEGGVASISLGIGMIGIGRKVEKKNV